MSESVHLPWRDIPLAIDPVHNGPGIWTSLLTEEAQELAKLAAGKQVLEIGSACGFASIAMAAQALHVTTVDLPAGWVDSGGAFTRNLAAYGVTNVTRILDSSFTVLPDLATQGKQYDLIFIDGDHSTLALTLDFPNSEALIAPGGIIACHDYMETCCCVDVKRTLDLLVPEGPDYIIGSMAVYKK